MRLGELLIQKGVITESQLLSALSRHFRTHDMLGECLILDGVITEQTMLMAVSEQTGIRYMDNIPKDVFTEFSLSLMTSKIANNLCAIIGENEFGLMVFINGNPENIKPLIEGSGKEVEFFLCKKSQIRQAISTAYHRVRH